MAHALRGKGGLAGIGLIYSRDWVVDIAKKKPSRKLQLRKGWNDSAKASLVLVPILTIAPMYYNFSKPVCHGV
jgi:hypothetical protein